MTRATLLATTTALLLPITGALAQSVDADANTSVGVNGTDAEASATVTGEAATGTDAESSDSTISAATESTGEADADAQTDLMAQGDATTVGDITGVEVLDATGEVIGSVEMVVEQSDGKAAVIGVGGFLGIGEHDVAIPASELSMEADGRLMLSGHTEEDLRERPAFNSSDAVALSADVELPDLG